MTHHDHALWYSLTSLTPHKLRKGNTPDEIDQNKKQKLITRLDHHKIMTHVGEHIHPRLQNIKQAPYILYTHGNQSLLDRPLLGIVGPRRMTDYAKRILNDLFASLADKQIATVSGLADGVDNYAHNLSIQHNIPTIAILGGGLAYMRKTATQKYEHILDNEGLLISEFRVHQETTKYSFPQRNRIIAGLSDIIFVPEAADASGTLITIHSALDQNTPVHATPHGLYETNHTGLQPLFAQQRISPVFDIAARTETHFAGQTSPSHHNTSSTSSLTSGATTHPDLGPHEQLVMDALATGPQTLTDLTDQTQLSHDDLIVAISLLDMQGYIHESHPGTYQR